MEGLQGRVCLIADPLDALGRAAAEKLMSRGAKPVLCAPPDEALKARLAELGGQYMVSPCGFEDFAQVRQCVENVRSAPGFGRVDAFFWNITPPVVRSSLSELSPQALESLISDHILHAYSAVKVLGDCMTEQGGGVIILRSSVNADKPTGIAGWNAMYYAAIKNLNREAALFYGYGHVRMAALELGAVGNEEEEYHNDISTFYDGYACKIPSGYTGGPGDIAGLVSYLMSDDCSCINGAEIRVDGGLLFQYIEPVMMIKTHERLRREGLE